MQIMTWYLPWADKASRIPDEFSKPSAKRLGLLPEMRVQGGAPVTFCWEPGHQGHTDHPSCAIWIMDGNISFLDG